MIEFNVLTEPWIPIRKLSGQIEEVGILKVLEEADLIIPRRDGRERWNHLNALPIQAIHDRWISQYAGHAMSVLSALKGELDG